MKNVLIVSYFFPPVGGAGVQRVTKFVKYLAEFGWQASVLTVSNPSVPLFDETLLKDVPGSVEVYKAKTLEPEYGAKKAISASAEAKPSITSAIKGLIRKVAIALLQPDPQVWWLPGAYRKACAVIREAKPDVIFASAPPFSSLVLGALLARKFKLPLVLDYRDEWDISNSVWENKQMGTISLKVQSYLQNYALKSASSVIATTSLSAQALKEKLTLLGSKADVVCIYNGFDGDDFPAEEFSEKTSTKYVLSYVGTLWNLTSIEPLVKALLELDKAHPEMAACIRVELAGRRTADQEKILEDLAPTCVELVSHDYLDHEKAVALVRGSHGLALLLSDMDIARRVVPGKLFEYFATSNTIFNIAPQGEVWSLSADYPSAYCCEPRDIKRIVESLATEIKAWKSGQTAKAIDFDAARYERKQLTGQLAECLNKSLVAS